MAKYQNPGRVDLEEMERAIIAAGGARKEESRPGGITHVVVYATSRNWHLSYDIHPDGSITDVHSTKDNHPIYDYKGGY